MSERMSAGKFSSSGGGGASDSSAGSADHEGRSRTCSSSGRGPGSPRRRSGALIAPSPPRRPVSGGAAAGPHLRGQQGVIEEINIDSGVLTLHAPLDFESATEEDFRQLDIELYAAEEGRPEHHGREAAVSFMQAIEESRLLTDIGCLSRRP